MTPKLRQEHILALVDFDPSITPDQAVQLLRKHNDDPNAAIVDWLDNGSSALQQPSTTWQEPDTFPRPGFNIQSDDVAASSIRAAASRPPSPANYPEGPIIDLTKEHAEAVASRALSLQEQQDIERRETAFAIALSKQDFSSTQENGVTGTGQQFGPASNRNYAAGQWDLVRTKTMAREIVEHPRPSKRRRLSNEPVFLRGTKETGYLAPLLTIYHSIPLAREALLFPSMKVHAYGHDPTWWNGTSDENSKAVSVEDPHGNHDANNLLCEVQCLMGFLDASNRAYGSVDALSDLRSYTDCQAMTPFTRLLEAWVQSALQTNPEDPYTQVFNSVAVKFYDRQGTEPVVKSFVCLEPETTSYESQSLYEVLDAAIWNVSAEKDLEDIWLDHCADIFTVKLHDPIILDKGLGLRVPAIWYPDRYQMECREISWDMRRQKQTLERRMSNLTEMQQKYQRVVLGPNGSTDVLNSLRDAKAAVAVAVKDNQLPNGAYEDMQPLLSEQISVSASQAQACLNDLDDVLERIEQKLQLLDKRKQDLRDEWRKVALRLTHDALEPDDKPNNKYYLQGVSTEPHVTYLRCRPAKSLIDFSDEMATNEEDPATWPWWRVSFSRDDVETSEALPVSGPVTEAEARAGHMSTAGGNGTSDLSRKVRRTSGSADMVGYSIRRLTEYEVLKAAREESNEVVLVYAAKRALILQSSPLAPPLQQFVDADNRAFEAELQKEQAKRWPTGIAQKQGDGLIFEDVPLDGIEISTEPASATLSREMTPMSLGSPKREVDDEEQPSPKRSKSSDDYALGQTLSDDPPPYEDFITGSIHGHEMQEKRSNGSFLRSNKIGQLSDKMMERVDEHERGETDSLNGETLHIEHSTAPLR